MVIGMVFFGFAAWTYLAATISAMTASVIMGAVFFGIGLIVLATAKLGRRKPKTSATATVLKQQPVQNGDLINAFPSGLAAGQKARS